MLVFSEFSDLFGNQTAGFVGTAAEAAVHLHQFAVLCDHGYHAALVDGAAVAADECFFLHSLLHYRAETHGRNCEPIRGYGVHIVGQKNLTGGDIPGVAAAVDINLDLLAVIGPGEAQFLISSPDCNSQVL